MDMFDVKRRDNPSMDDHMNLKKPGFGGPSSKEDFEGSKRKSLKGYQRVIDRNADFEGGNFNHNYDPTWKAVTRDLISRTAKKKPFDPMYAKPTIATVDAVEEGKILRFDQFVNEEFNMYSEADENTMDDAPEEGSEEMMNEPEVDQEKLDNLMTEFGDDLEEMINDIAEKMEIEKDEVCDLLCAAVKKICMPEEEEEETEEQTEEVSEDESSDDDENNEM